MNRTQKVAEVESLKAKFAQSVIAIVSDYRGLSVSSLTDLRGKLREKDSSFKVVKNRLAKLAIKETDAEGLTDFFVGTTAVTLSQTDPAGPAKVLTDFAKDHEGLQIKGAYLDGKMLDIREIKALAELPSKDELIAKLMGSMQAPAQNVVNVLSQIPRQVVNVLSAVKDQKEQNQ